MGRAAFDRRLGPNTFTLNNLRDTVCSGFVEPYDGAGNGVIDEPIQAASTTQPCCDGARHDATLVVQSGLYSAIAMMPLRSLIRSGLAMACRRRLPNGTMV